MYFGFVRDIAFKSEKLVVGLDIGTSKVFVVVGEVKDHERDGEEGFSVKKNSRSIRIIGTGTASSRGMKKGAVTNIEKTVEAIRQAVKDAETMAGIDIKAVQTGITGAHIGCLSSHGVIAVKEKEIGQREIDSVLEAAKAVAIPFDREMLHIIPSGYSVNGQNGISDPRGMCGIRLETNVGIITGESSSVQNLIRCCRRAGLEVIDVIFQPLASAEAVLTQDEKDLGVAVIDMGAGTTDLVLFREGKMCHSSVVPIGGDNFTNDIAIGLRIPRHEAEAVKRKYGCSMMSLVKDDREIETGRVNEKQNKTIPQRYLVEILQPRAEELFALIKDEITGKGFHNDMNSGVVLTGGAALMEGMDVMAEHILELPVRIGTPEGFGTIDNIAEAPSCSAGIGLMMYGLEENLSAQGFKDGNIFAGFRNRMKNWFSEVFR